MLPSCSTTAKPFVIGYSDAVGSYSFTSSSTPGEACQAIAAYAGQSIVSVTTNSCSLTNRTIAFPIMQTCEVDPGVISPERLQDLMALFYIAVPVLVAVFGAKKLLNLFDTDHEKA